MTGYIQMGDALIKSGNRGGMRFSPREIIGTLRDMNFVAIEGKGYIPAYTRTDTQIVTKKAMRRIIALTKGRAKVESER